MESSIELTEDEMHEREEENAARALRALEAKRDTWVKAMEPAHKRMIEDVRQREAKPRRVSKTKVDHSGDDDRGPPMIHATRSLTDLIEARISDMLFPVAQPQWRFDAEPVQDEDAFMLPDGRVVPNELRAQHVESAVREQEKVIRDQFTESKFAAISRKVIRDGCQLGFGLYLGPVVAVKRKERFIRVPVESGLMGRVGAMIGNLMGRPPQTEVQVNVQVIEESVPGLEYGNPWRFFPEPVEDLEQASGFFYYDLMNESEMRELADVPSARKEEIAELLMCQPDHGKIGAMIRERSNLTGFVESLDGRYVVWRYEGCMSREDLQAMGCECDPLTPLPMVQMRFCQGKVLQYKMNPNKGSYRIPAHVFTPFPDTESWMGLSVPYLCRDSAKGAQAAYEIALLNASVSAGVITVIREGLKPADGKYEIRGPKTFIAPDDERSLSDYFHFETVDNVGQQAVALMERHLQMMSEDLNLPQFTNPEVNKPTNTASGMAMWMNAQTVVQRRSAAAFDDCIAPMLRAFVRFNRLYSDNPAFQVDVQVVPLGQSELLVKDIEIQNVMAYIGMAQSNPELGAITDMTVLSKHLAQQFRLPDGAILSTEQAAERAQQKPQDPMAEIERAKLELAQRDRAIAEAKLQADMQDKQRDDDFRAQDRMLDHKERMAEIAAKEQQMQLDAIKMQTERELRLMELAQSRELSIEELKAKLEMHQSSNALQQYITGFKGTLEAKKVAANLSEQSLKLNPNNQTGTGI